MELRIMTIKNKIKVFGLGIVVTLSLLIQLVMQYIAHPRLYQSALTQVKISIENSGNQLKKDLVGAEAITRL